MARLLLIILLFLSSSPAYGDWTLTGANDDETAYVNSDTIRSKGDRVKMWSLIDHKTIRTSPRGSFLSNKAQMEYDCAEERQRILAIQVFSGQMGSGHVVYSDSHESEWSPVSPDSIGLALWKRACNKK
jgi:hypothetical protein